MSTLPSPEEPRGSTTSTSEKAPLHDGCLTHRGEPVFTQGGEHPFTPFFVGTCPPPFLALEPDVCPSCVCPPGPPWQSRPPAACSSRCSRHRSSPCCRTCRTS